MGACDGPLRLRTVGHQLDQLLLRVRVRVRARVRNGATVALLENPNPN